MLFTYTAIDQDGHDREGSIEAPSQEVAVSALQRRSLIISKISAAEGKSIFNFNLPMFGRISNKEIVILSRQVATLFEAQVPSLRIFRLLAAESATPVLARILTAVTDDLNSGLLISAALAKHPEVFSDFYINMVKSGEETGKIAEAFTFLAAYLERSHTLSTKARNAMIYPAFVVCSFIGVMILMLVYVIPKLSVIIEETGQEVPIYTKIVLAASDFFVNFGVILLLIFAAAVFFVYRYLQTEAGKLSLSHFKLTTPVVRVLFEKLYLSRIADTLSTMLISGIPMVRALEISAEVVGNSVYRNILLEASVGVKSGSAISALLYKYPEVPSMMIQMIKVGEETGKLGFILDTLSRFYQREVYNAVETLVDLIEPALIVFLGVGVAILLTSVLVPIYNVASGL